MGYQFTEAETLPAAIRRIVRERIDQAVDRLSDEHGDRHEAIHDARKRLKETRAVLRAIRSELGDPLFRFENTHYAGAGRELSAVRDAQAMIETIELLREALEERVGREVYRRIRANLVQRRRRVLNQTGDMIRVLERLIESLLLSARRVDAWPLVHDGFEALRPGIERTYRSGRRAFAAAYADPSPEQFHEWRKRVKEQWYHAQLLRDVWPEVMKVVQKSLEDLSRTLGRYHDLDVLRDLVIRRPRAFGGADSAARVLEVVAENQEALAARARDLGDRLFAEKPKQYAKRLEQYWNAWHSDARRAVAPENQPEIAERVDPDPKPLG